MVVLVEGIPCPSARIARRIRQVLDGHVVVDRQRAVFVNQLRPNDVHQRPQERIRYATGKSIVIVLVDGEGPDSTELSLQNILGLPSVGLDIVERDPFFVETMGKCGVGDHPGVVPRGVEVLPLYDLLSTQLAELLDAFNRCGSSADAQLQRVEVGIRRREHYNLLGIQTCSDVRLDAVVLGRKSL